MGGKSSDFPQFQRVNLDELQGKAVGFSRQNAVESQKLENELMPALGATRPEFYQQVLDDLRRGGMLSPEVSNEVNKAGFESAGGSGTAGSQFARGTLGQMRASASQALRDARLNRAGGVVTGTPMPTTGLNPGDLASAAVGDMNALNQYNAAKAAAAAQQKAATKSTIGSLAGTAIGAGANMYAAGKKP